MTAIEGRDAADKVQGGVHAEQEPNLLGTTENELGLRKWIEEQGHTLVTTSDKEGENSKFDQELVDAEVIITTPYVKATPHCRSLPRNTKSPHHRVTNAEAAPQLTMSLQLPPRLPDR